MVCTMMADLTSWLQGVAGPLPNVFWLLLVIAVCGVPPQVLQEAQQYET